MISMDFNTLAESLKGRLLNRKFGEVLFNGVSIDSRTIQPDQLFIAIKGINTDGHKYLDDAIEKKCAGMMVNNSFAPAWELQGKTPIVVVDNTHEAMIELARMRRAELKAKIIGITGSNGKTTTKEITWAILKSKRDKVYKSPGNFNNLFGLPLAIFEISDDTEYAVMEMGISIKGEMTRLAGIANPDLILITNVGPTHLETLGSVEGVAEAKLELVDAAEEEIPVILNADDMVLMEAAGKRNREYVTFGFRNDAGIKGVISGITRDGCSRIFIDGRQVEARLFGAHQAYNLLAGYAVAKTLGLDIIPDDLNRIEFASASFRGDVERLDGLTIVADCYNANPTSMKSGLLSFKSFVEYNRGESKRSIVIVGDMLELGENAERYHREIGKLLADLDFDLNVTIGPLSQAIHDAALEAGVEAENLLHYEDITVAGNQLIENIEKGDIVYLKASRGIGLEKLITLLKGSAVREN